jgi:uncharacterized membrane protein YqjE
MIESKYATERNGRTVGEVIVELKDEIKDFVQTRVQMFVSEMREKLRDSKSASIYAAVGVILLGTAYLLLNLALVGLLAVAFWGSPYAWFWAFLIVGSCWLILGGFVGALALRKFQGLAPKKTIEVLKEDKIWLQQEARNQA